MTLESIFAAASQKPAGERAAFLDQECGDNAELRKKVERLLAAHDEAGSFLQPATGDYQSRGDVDDAAGTIIAGKYKLLERIGEGGMGTVWMAEQREPVKRLVAVKLIKAGMDSKAVLARFEAERQALAVMDHPNIAKILDGGVTGEPGASATGGFNRQTPPVAHAPGSPFFVMELVKGVPITKYCDDHKLTPRERLELFVPVCQAIQHAHQKGIIHRDIKPSNVIVALYDDKPVPKVIDFGVAKATGQTLTEQTLHTGFGGIVGTPEYMSPEQASLNNLDIDTRSDIYSLGVLLYELLAGSPPFKRKELEQAGMLEMLRLIREVEPPKPSTKLSTADALPSLSANRGTEPKKLTGILRNELDWIVMKALEKDRVRRYETANGFAADINRYLAGEPVNAHPPSAGYRLRKLVRRNKGAVLAAGLVFAALMIGLVATLWQAHQTEFARREAVTAAEREGVERKMADAARGEAERQATIAQAKEKDANDRREETEAVLKFVENRIFAAARPEAYGGLGRDVTLQRAVLAALPAIANTFNERPLIEARLRRAIGNAFNQLGDYDLAVEQFRRARELYSAALGPVHKDTLGTIRITYSLLIDATRYTDALAVSEDGHRLCESLLGPLHPDTLGFMVDVAEGYWHTGRPADGLTLGEKTYRLCETHLGKDHNHTLACMSVLANCYGSTRRFDEELAINERLVSLLRAKHEKFHSSHFNYLHNLVGSYLKTGRTADAVALSEQTLKNFQTHVGREDRNTLVWMLNLADLYSKVGRIDDAVSLSEQTVAVHSAKLGPDHPDTLMAMTNLGAYYLRAKRPDDALALQEKTLPLVTARLGPHHSRTLWTLNNLGMSYLTAGRYDEAASTLDQGISNAAGRRDLDPRLPSALFSNRLDVSAKRKDGAGCRSTADKWEYLQGLKGGDFYDSACFRATCAAVMRETGEAGADEQADKAMEWLRKAVAAGYKNVAHMKKDTDLDPLREREDFKMLIADLEKKPETKSP